jgi:hypothetical protein
MNEDMTEGQWFAETNPYPLLCHLRDRASERKLRLFVCGCWRRFWHLLTDERTRQAVAVGERHADGLAGADELATARQAPGPWGVEVAWTGLGRLWPYRDSSWTSDMAETVASAAGVWGSAAWETAREAAARLQCAIVRDLFGNPFQPVTLDPAWLTADVVALARAASAERILPRGELDPARLVVLADALEEAGCTEQALLDHLRGPGRHVQGCFALDLLLGKA